MWWIAGSAGLRGRPTRWRGGYAGQGPKPGKYSKYTVERGDATSVIRRMPISPDQLSSCDCYLWLHLPDPVEFGMTHTRTVTTDCHYGVLRAV